MAIEGLTNPVLLVTGSCLKAERLDRPLAYRVRDEAQRRIDAFPGAKSDIVVMGDIWYLNSRELHSLPTISVGGPGVNHLAAYWQSRVPMALWVENIFQIQMDGPGERQRCCIWGMDHETTVEAVDTFLQKGHFDRFMSRVFA